MKTNKNSKNSKNSKSGKNGKAETRALNGEHERRLRKLATYLSKKPRSAEEIEKHMAVVRSTAHIMPLALKKIGYKLKIIKGVRSGDDRHPQMFHVVG